MSPTGGSPDRAAARGRDLRGRELRSGRLTSVTEPCLAVDLAQLFAAS